MIVHESRNADFRRPFGAAEVRTGLYLAAECPGAETMTLRLHTFIGEDRLLPMEKEREGRFSLSFSAPETPCVLWYSFLAAGEESMKLHSLNPAYPVMRFTEGDAVYLIGRALSVVGRGELASGADREKYLLLHPQEG